jgi:hypothetical protein
MFFESFRTLSAYTMRNREPPVNQSPAHNTLDSPPKPGIINWCNGKLITIVREVFIRS